jgi:hypothetical protein
MKMFPTMVEAPDFSPGSVPPGLKPNAMETYISPG